RGRGPVGVSFRVSYATPHRTPAFRHRPRRDGFVRLAQEAEERLRFRSRLIKTPDWIADRPPREAVFLYALMLQRMSLKVAHRVVLHRRTISVANGEKRTFSEPR
ncbi:MAG: hypothetical protein WBG15_10345, partial [Xanthobacteraceae bacterium]